MASTLDSNPSVNDSLDLHRRAADRAFWRDEAPAGITGSDQWAIWTKHLAKRKNPANLQELCNSSKSPLNWGVDESTLAPGTQELLNCSDGSSPAKSNGKSKAASQKLSQALASWSCEPEATPASVDFALECLTVAHALPRVAGELEEQRWWQLLDELLQLANSAIDWPIDSEMPPAQTLAHQLLAAELPLTLAWLFPEIKPCYKLRQLGSEALGEGLQELTNGQGLVRGTSLDCFRLLLATWIRSYTLVRQLKKTSLSDDASEQLNWAATQAMRLSTDDGRSLLGTGNIAWTPDFLAHLLKTAGDRADASAALDIFGKRLTKSISVKPNNRFPETSDHCEWAGVATMRTEWEPGLPTLAVDFSSPDLRIEIASGADSIIQGIWNWQTTVEGQSLEPIGSWDETCWFSDDDVDYLELSIELSGGAQLDRQILLAREDHFLLLADNVLNTAGGEVRHSMSLPLCSNVSFATEAETREGLLVSNRTIGRVLPLALPEWRSDPRIGELAMIDGSLQLVQQRVGKSLACPLFIDLDRQRARKQCTWRQLTIAQALEIQPHDVAVGFRAQCGKHQWLFYRSLAEAANRSLLGQNISCECLVARFLSPSGEIEEMLEIEG